MFSRMILLGFIYVNNVARFAGFFTLVKEALIEIGCVVTSLVVGRWLSRACTVAKQCIAYSYYGTLIGNPTPGIQWYNFRPPGVTPNWGMGPP